jgi:hypothetical protein
LVVPGQGSLLYKYKTEVKLSVANGQYDLKTEITADVNIKALGNCDYALQVRCFLLINFIPCFHPIASKCESH